ncbi:RNA polymerase sigma factor [Psychroflexus halocasei]|uniref:RNA polymerase sigma factor, sigma-70 family n=1 Tax=Psychroflexus halocasei TaxID=908615 RepID=A0A1H4AJK6_9FLAO|nr:sigma-70 family RNA polymerase sigma factor [Psychroflexus halocasei]SEA35822.1 RNA polymerase sigma factor, sigma-70 family [Psychroflexus halocasei]
MSVQKAHPDQKYIEGLKQDNSFVIREIYDKFAPKVIHFICQNNGDDAQAKDVIQEVLLVIYDQACIKDLKLTCPFDAYFFLLCKRRWYNKLKKKKLDTVTIKEEIVSEHEGANHLEFETSLFQDQQELFKRMFGELGKSCQDLLKKSFEIDSMKKVAEKLDISYAYARKKKSLCIGKLTEMIQNSPHYKNLKS